MITDASTEFFNDLGHRGHIPMMTRVNGTMRFDLVEGDDTESYYVTLKKGDVTVSEGGGDADCVVRTDRAVFDELVSGEENALSATLRGEVSLSGNTELLVMFQRLFPGPPSSRHEHETQEKEARS